MPRRKRLRRAPGLLLSLLLLLCSATHVAVAFQLLPGQAAAWAGRQPQLRRPPPSIGAIGSGSGGSGLPSSCGWTSGSSRWV